MPKRSLHSLVWSMEYQRYELSRGGSLQRCFALHDEQTWQDWLGEQTSFAFQGQRGHLSVVKEGRARGGGYWYAYGSPQGGSRKHYLGPTPKVTLARLEVAAGSRAALPSSLPRQPLVLPMLASRFIPPRLPTTLVERADLQARLDKALALPLTLLSSSGGWGKTTLLSVWVRRSSHVIAWLSLDEMDSIPVRFWGAVIAALRTRHAGIGTTALALLYAPQPVHLSLILTSLLNEMATLEGTTVLVLDDYHLITDTAIHESLLYVLEHLPTNLRLVLSTRVDPPLPLARLRMRGQISEIRDQDLSFRADDVRHFLLQLMELPLAETEVAILERRTEGWIAGLQLAALALRQCEDHAAFVQTFGGSHRYVLDYFQDDILAHLPPAAQNFLFQTAILSRLHAPLCQAVTGETASQELLEGLERDNLFLVPLDEERRWYRLHELFRQTLLARLTLSHPAQVPVLHLRAARWYEAQGTLREALAHALAAEDFAYAARLMERAAAEAWAMGEARTVHAWIALLPDEVLRAHMPFALVAALRLLHTLFGVSDEQQRNAVGPTIDRLERLLSEVDLTTPEHERQRRRVRLFHLWSAASRAIGVRDMTRLRQCCQEMLPLAGEDDIIWQMAPLFVNVILCMNTLAACDDLKAALLAAGQQAEETQQRYAWLRTRQWLALILWEAGDLHQAELECRMLLALLEREGTQHTSIGGYLSLTLARICWSGNRCEEAHFHLVSALQLAQDWQYMALLAECVECRVVFAIDQGRLDEAEQGLHTLRHLTQQGGIAIRLPQVESVQLRLWLAQGNLAAAQTWADQTCFDQDGPTEASFWETSLSLARLRLAQHAYGAAGSILTRLLNSAEQGQRRERVAQILALQVSALAGLKDREHARQLALRLLQVAQAADLIHVFLNAGEPMRRTLQQLHTPHPTEATLSGDLNSHLTLLLEAFEHEERRHHLSAPPLTRHREASSSSGSTSTQPALHEPLSAQEQRVLRLLVAGHTYAEIARELIVSPNTIKTQVSSIYRKLGVSRRAEASLVAQRLHLL